MSSQRSKDYQCDDNANSYRGIIGGWVFDKPGMLYTQKHQMSSLLGAVFRGYVMLVFTRKPCSYPRHLQV